MWRQWSKKVLKKSMYSVKRANWATGATNSRDRRSRRRLSRHQGRRSPSRTRTCCRPCLRAVQTACRSARNQRLPCPRHLNRPHPKIFFVWSSHLKNRRMCGKTRSSNSNCENLVTFQRPKSTLSQWSLIFSLVSLGQYSPSSARVRTQRTTRPVLTYRDC